MRSRCEHMNPLWNSIRETRSQCGRVLGEPVGGFAGAYNPGIILILHRFRELPAFVSLEVSEKNQTSRRLDRAMARASHSPKGETRLGIRQCGFEDRDLHVEADFIRLERGNMELCKLLEVHNEADR